MYFFVNTKKTKKKKKRDGYQEGTSEIVRNQQKKHTHAHTRSH